MNRAILLLPGPKAIEEGQHLDVVADALDSLTSLHRDKPKFRAFITAILRQIQPLVDASEKMLLWRSINQAQGETLAHIAEIVGAPLVTTEDVSLGLIGWQDEEGGLPMWDETNPTITGGRFRERDEQDVDVTWNNAQLQRFVIRAQILKNHSHGFTPEMSEALGILFGGGLAFVENNKDMSFDINIGHLLESLEVFLLREWDILPRPAGVELRTFVHWDNTLPVFGFDHQQGTSGFDVGYFALAVR